MRSHAVMVAAALAASFAGPPLQAGEDPAVMTPHQPVLVLPLDFRYFKRGVATIDVAVEKSATARRNLDGSLQRAFERERHVVYGVASPHGTHLIRYDAPAIYYFERHLPEFEAAVATFELL